LNQDDVMVLDAGEEIYIWVGKDSSKEEQEKASTMAEVLTCLIKSWFSNP
jgi:Gelsolin repeat